LRCFDGQVRPAPSNGIVFEDDNASYAIKAAFVEIGDEGSCIGNGDDFSGVHLSCQCGVRFDADEATVAFDVNNKAFR
jgi:hypothetical protein